MGWYYSCCCEAKIIQTEIKMKLSVQVSLLLLLVAPQVIISAPTGELLRTSWNSWQVFERENLPWLANCEGVIGLFCPGPGPDVYDVFQACPASRVLFHHREKQ